jgi:hypothetical protein
MVGNHGERALWEQEIQLKDEEAQVDIKKRKTRRGEIVDRGRNSPLRGEI